MILIATLGESMWRSPDDDPVGQRRSGGSPPVARERELQKKKLIIRNLKKKNKDLQK